MATKNLEELKSQLISDIEQRVTDKILEKTDADLLAKLINQADSEAEAMNIMRLGTTYKRTGFHFFPHCALNEMPCSNNIKYKAKNEKLSFVNDASRPTHELIIGDNFDALQNLMITHKGKIDVIYILTHHTARTAWVSSHKQTTIIQLLAIICCQCCILVC